MESHVLGVALGYAGFAVSFVLVVLFFDGSSASIAVLTNIVANAGAASIC